MLINKQRKIYLYYSRYQNTDYYYDTEFNRYFMGKSQWLKDSTPYIEYVVKRNDTYDSIALEAYNNPTYWWIITDFNRIDDPFKNPTENSTLKIPIFSNIEFEN